MARKLVIATHGRLADGYKDSLSILVGDLDITTINCFTEDTDPKKTIEAFMQNTPMEDEIVVFTDIMAGSPNQMFVPYAVERNVHLITGINLPLICEVLLTSDPDKMEVDHIQACIEASRGEIKYVNAEMEQIQSSGAINDNDGDNFF